MLSVNTPTESIKEGTARLALEELKRVLERYGNVVLQFSSDKPGSDNACLREIWGIPSAGMYVFGGKILGPYDPDDVTSVTEGLDHIRRAALEYAKNKTTSEVAIGFDTEWDSAGGVQGKVVLIQLGVPQAVVLYRCQVGINRVENLPPSLLAILNDNNFMKVE